MHKLLIHVVEFIIHNDNSFEYTPPEGRVAKILNSRYMIDFYIPHQRRVVYKFFIYDV